MPASANLSCQHRSQLTVSLRGCHLWPRKPEIGIMVESRVCRMCEVLRGPMTISLTTRSTAVRKAETSASESPCRLQGGCRSLLNFVTTAVAHCSLLYVDSPLLDWRSHGANLSEGSVHSEPWALLLRHMQLSSIPPCRWAPRTRRGVCTCNL